MSQPPPRRPATPRPGTHALPPRPKPGLLIRTALAGQARGEFAFPQDKDKIAIGRSTTCDVVLDNPAVSNLHAEIHRSGELFAVVDRDSDNGTHLNGRRLSRPTLLNDGDELAIAKFMLTIDAKQVAASFLAALGRKSDLGVGSRDPTVALTADSARRMTARRTIASVTVTHSGQPAKNLFIADVLQVGKSHDCDVQLSGFFAPRRALLIVRAGEEYRVFNVSQSADSTMVNGKPLANMETLSPGDVIEVGGVTLAFAISGT